MDTKSRLVSVGATAILDLAQMHEIAPASPQTLMPEGVGYWVCGYPDPKNYGLCAVQIVVPAEDLAKILFPEVKAA